MAGFDRCPRCGRPRADNSVVCETDGAVLVPADADPLLDTSVGAYRVVRRLGVGATGAVYEAREEAIGKRAALKVLHGFLVRGPTAPSLLPEAQAVNAIRDEGIVDVYGQGTLPDGRPYILMELLEGELLEDRLIRAGALGVVETIDLTCSILQALEAAHAAGFVHRDIKPANIFLAIRPGRPVRPKLLDFGIAFRVLSSTDVPVGTPGFAAPEQTTNVGMGPKADLYALGCVMFEMLTNAQPFVSRNVEELLDMHAQRPRPSLRELKEAIPPELDALVQRMMAIDPVARPSSAVAVRMELLELKKRLENPRRTGEHRSSAGTRRTRLLVGTAVVLVMLASAGLAWRRSTGAENTFGQTPVFEPVPSSPVDPLEEEVKRTAANIQTQMNESLAEGVTALIAAEATFPQRPEWTAARARLSTELRTRIAADLNDLKVDSATDSMALLIRVGLVPEDDDLVSLHQRTSYALSHGMVRSGGVFIDRYEYPNQAGGLPTTQVDWADAVELCKGAGKHLCSEFEWERACKGAAGANFPWGTGLNPKRCSLKGKGAVASGTYTDCRGEEGVFDLIGNVAEWTESELAVGRPQRVLRGGSFVGANTKLASCVARDYRLPGIGGAADIGFRCCL